MNDDPRIDADTTERILSGHDADPPELHELLADATAPAHADELTGEEAAVAAFHTNRRPITPPAAAPRIPAFKAALIALLLALIGGTALAATSHHLPLSHHHAPRATPAATSHHTRPATSRLAPDRPQAPLHHHGHHKRPHPPHPNKKNKSKSQQQPEAHKYKTHKNVPAHAKK